MQLLWALLRRSSRVLLGLSTLAQISTSLLSGRIRSSLLRAPWGGGAIRVRLKDLFQPHREARIRGGGLLRAKLAVLIIRRSEAPAIISSIAVPAVHSA